MLLADKVAAASELPDGVGAMPTRRRAGNRREAGAGWERELNKDQDAEQTLNGPADDAGIERIPAFRQPKRGRENSSMKLTPAAQTPSKNPPDKGFP